MISAAPRETFRHRISTRDAVGVGHGRDWQIHHPRDCRDAVSRLARQSDSSPHPISQAMDTTDPPRSHHLIRIRQTVTTKTWG
jgi:hypothetical protein